MNVRQPLALVVLAAGLVSSVATSYATPCNWGVWPLDGATGVPLATAIVFRGGWIDEEMPAFTADVAGLELMPEGTPVEVDVELDFEAEAVRLIPRRPLQVDRVYRAYGIEEEALESPNHMEGFLPSALSSTVIFTTASDPQIWEVLQVESDQLDFVEFVVVLSQAGDTATVDDDTLVLTNQETGAVLPSTWAGLYQGEPHLLLFQLQGSDSLLLEVDASVAELSDDLLAEDGLTFSADEDLPLTLVAEQKLDAYQGLANCSWR